MAVDPNSPEGRSARAWLDTVLANFGLYGGIGQYLWGRYLEGWSSDQIMLEMRNTPEYRRRFAGLVSLREKGRAISEQEYIRLEGSYAQVLRRWGLPAGFYDHSDDFAWLIMRDVSPAEVERRVQLAQETIYNAPHETRMELQRLYGVRPGDLVAYMLDPDRALPLIEKQMRTATVSGAAQRAGMRELSYGEVHKFALDLTEEEINQRINLYTQAAYGEPIETRRELARLYGITDITGVVVNPDIAVAEIQKRLIAGRTAGISQRVGWGDLNIAEAERLGTVGTTEEEFQAATRDRSLFTEVLPGSETIDETLGRETQIDILAGSEPARQRLERKRGRRVAEFKGGGGVARTEKGFTGLGTAES